MSEHTGKRKATSESPQCRKKVALSAADSSVHKQELSDAIFGNVDLVVLVLEFVAEERTSDVLDTCSLVSQTFSKARNHERFDQTRTGTIVFRRPYQCVPRETWERWNEQVFTGNRTRLVAVLTEIANALVHNGRHADGTSSAEFPRYPPPFSLENVRQVVLQGDPSIPVHPAPSPPLLYYPCVLFQTMSPNLDTLDIGALAKACNDREILNHVHVDYGSFEVTALHCVTADDHQTFCVRHPSSLSIRAISSRPHDRTTPKAKRAKVREYHVDPFCMRIGEEPIEAYCKEQHEYENDEWFHRLLRRSIPRRPSNFVLLEPYPNLERVTLGRAKYLERHDPEAGAPYYKTLPQEALIKFVRHTPTLCWFKSDLTAENVAMLMAERPEVEFVQAQERRA